MASRRARALTMGAAALGFAGLGALALAASTADRWFLDALDPGPFDPAATPPAPDPDLPSGWAALPETDDGADVSIPDLPPHGPGRPRADVFYLHPTTWVGPAWNGPTDDPAVMLATERGGTLIQASAFNACCDVYAPRYRQTHGLAYVRPDAQGQQARDVAYGDIERAFDAFRARTQGRPFYVVAHSQGSVLGARLVRERIAGTPEQTWLIAAWLLGGPLSAEDVGLPPCAAADDLACVVAWNARGPEYTPGGLEFDRDHPERMADRVCVNPLSWAEPGRHVGRQAHAGAVFLDTPAPALVPAFADARCRDGALVITEHGDLQRDLPSTVLLWMMGPDNLHPVEYQLFWADIRANATVRMQAWFDVRVGDGPY